MSTLCSQADSCSLGAKRPALFSTLVVTEISLWTLTQPMCTCSCVWVCVHGCVCVYMCVLHCNSRGWSWKVFFFTWLPFFLLMTEAVGWWEESRPTVWNVGERQLCHKSLPTAPSPGGLPPLSHRPDPPPPPRNNLVIWSYCQMCWISFPPGSSQYDHSSPTSGHWASWLDEKHQYHGKGETGSWLAEYNCIPGVFLHFQDIPSSLLCIILVGHTCDSYKVVQPVQCKLWPSWRELPIFYVH